MTRRRTVLAVAATLALTLLAVGLHGPAASASTRPRSVRPAAVPQVPHVPPIPCDLPNDGQEYLDADGLWECFCDPQVDDQGRLEGGYSCDWWLIKPRPSAQTEMKSTSTALFMDVYHAMTGNGTKIQLYTRNNSVAQWWSWQPRQNPNYPKGYTFQIRNPNSNRCAAIRGGSRTPGTNLILWDCIGSYDQIWMARTKPGLGWFTIFDTGTRQCLDFATGTVGAPLMQWACDRSASQRWVFES